MIYKTLGFAVWKAGSWYLRRRYGTASKRMGLGGVALAAAAGAVALVAQRRSAPAP